MTSNSEQEQVMGHLGTPENLGRPNRRVWLTIGISCWILLTFFHQRNFNWPTAVSRLDLIMALCTESRFQITTFHNNTPDKAIVNGVFYSDKAPGTVAWALLGAAPAVWIADNAGLDSTDRRLWLVSSWAGCASLNVIVAFGFVCLVKLLSSVSKMIREAFAITSSPREHYKTFSISLASATFMVFGGMAWPYSTIMFSHAQAIGCIAAGLWMLHQADRRYFVGDGPQESPELKGSTARKRLILGAGFAFGWALNSEFTTGLVVFGVPLVAFGFKGRHWVPFSAGLMVPCLLIPIYSWATIGIPWKLPYSYQASFPEMEAGLYAIGLPDPVIAAKLLFSPERGLIYWCPFITIALLGYYVLYRAGARKLLWLTYLLPAIHIVVISGRVWDWPAGPTFSARYLAPIIPLLAIPCALGLAHAPKLGSALGILSIFLTGLITVTDATPSFKDHHQPLITLTLPLLKTLDFNPSLLSEVFGVSPVVSVLGFCALFPVLLWFLPGRTFRRG